MDKPTIAEMIDSAIHNYIRIKAKHPTLLVLNRLAYLTLLAFCVDLHTNAPIIGEPNSVSDSSTVKAVNDLYVYRGMDIAVLQAPTVCKDEKYTVLVMVH